MDRDRPGPSPPRLSRDDRGVSEVVGFIFMFTIAFTVLSLSLVLVSDRISSSTTQNRKGVFNEAGASVGSAVQEAVMFSDLYPNATFERRVELPDGLSGVPYRMTVTNRSVWVNATSETDDTVVRYGGFDLSSEGIWFERTSVASMRLQVTYVRCPVTGGTGPCSLPSTRAGGNLLVQGVGG